VTKVSPVHRDHRDLRGQLDLRVCKVRLAFKVHKAISVQWVHRGLPVLRDRLVHRVLLVLREISDPKVLRVLRVRLCRWMV
jgi:hypothetical protein